MDGEANRDDLIELALHAMDNVHDMDVPWRTYAAAVVDALIEGGAIPVWQAIDKAPTDSTIAAQSIALIQQMVRSIEDRAAEVWGRQSYPRATLFIWKDKLWFGVHGNGIRRNVSGRGATVTDAYADILERLGEHDPAHLNRTLGIEEVA